MECCPMVDSRSGPEAVCIWVGEPSCRKDTQYPLEEAELIKPEETIEGAFQWCWWWWHGTKKRKQNCDLQ